MFKKKKDIFSVDKPFDTKKPIRLKIEAHDGEKTIFSEEYEIFSGGTVRRVRKKTKKRPKTL